MIDLVTAGRGQARRKIMPRRYFRDVNRRGFPALGTAIRLSLDDYATVYGVLFVSLSGEGSIGNVLYKCSVSIKGTSRSMCSVIENY